MRIALFGAIAGGSRPASAGGGPTLARVYRPQRRSLSGAVPQVHDRRGARVCRDVALAGVLGRPVPLVSLPQDVSVRLGVRGGARALGLSDRRLRGGDCLAHHCGGERQLHLLLACEGAPGADPREGDSRQRRPRAMAPGPGRGPALCHLAGSGALRTDAGAADRGHSRGSAGREKGPGRRFSGWAAEDGPSARKTRTGTIRSHVGKPCRSVRRRRFVAQAGCRSGASSFATRL